MAVLASRIPTIRLNDGTSHLMIGFGTYKIGYIPPSATGSGGVATVASDTATIRKIFMDAVDCGYRFFDCAQFYNNEKIVGEALKACGIPRDQLYLGSKVWTDKMYAGAEAIRGQLRQTLSDLQTDYLDLYLLHWPVPTKHVEAWLVLEQLKNEGKVRAIGLSNYTIEDYNELKPHVTIKPAINQLEVNPFLYRKNTIDFFQKEGIVIQAYRALRQGQEMNNPIITNIASKNQKTPAQILGRWCIQKQIVYIPKTVSKHRMLENLAILDFVLTDEEIKQLDSLTTQQNLDAFKVLYEKCVIRDTPIKEFKTNVTID